MAYTPDAATQAALEKSRRGQPLSPAERTLLSTHSQRLIEQMRPTTGGSGGAYDYGTTGQANYGGYGATMSSDGSAGITDYDKYQNFIREEQTRRAQGLPPRQLPSPFTQFLSTQNPLGYNGQNDVLQMKTTNPTASSTGAVKYQPMNPSTVPYSYNNTTTPQVNQAVPPATAGASGPVPTDTPFNVEAALPSAPQTVRNASGGLQLGNSVAGIDEGKILSEAEMQKQLAQQTYQQQIAGRKAMLDDLSTVLQKQQAAALNDQMPGVYEDLNTRGLLRSSALGEKVGLEGAKLARQTSEQLALQGLQDRGTAINDLSGIENNYLGQRNSALQRRFSLEDFDRQLEAGKTLGAQAIPQVSSPSAKGSSALQGAIGGATIGSKFGVGGAVTGGLLGGVGGGQLGSK